MIVKDSEGIRLDTYLSEKLDLSRSKVQKLIKANICILAQSWADLNPKKTRRRPLL